MSQNFSHIFYYKQKSKLIMVNTTISSCVHIFKLHPWGFRYFSPDPDRTRKICGPCGECANLNSREMTGIQDHWPINAVDGPPCIKHRIVKHPIINQPVKCGFGSKEWWALAGKTLTAASSDPILLSISLQKILVSLSYLFWKPDEMIPLQDLTRVHRDTISINSVLCELFHHDEGISRRQTD